MTRLVFDIETDGLIPAMTTIHCIITKDPDTGRLTVYRADAPGAIRAALAALAAADEVIGHNIAGFDIPAIQKLYPSWAPTGRVTDTLIISQLIYTDMRDRDTARLKKKPGCIPGNLAGRHSLESWGHRLGYHKGDYSKVMKERGLDPWKNLNDDMVDYCANDVELNAKLLGVMEAEQYAQTAIDLEHVVSRHCREQMAFGCAFDRAAAVELYGQLTRERAELERNLIAAFGSWFTPRGVERPKRTMRRFVVSEGGPETRKAPATRALQQGYFEIRTEGAFLTKVEEVEFNPSSRDHIANRLTALYGWKPREFTDTGKPKVDEETLDGLQYPEASLLIRYLLVDKRIGQLAEGEQAWLKVLENDGRIYGRITPNGAVTGRATHQRPNLGQVPKVGSPFGKECRALFRATPGWTFVGADASGLELRCLAHYMARWDGGAYADIVLHGDIHWANVIAMGLVAPGTLRNDALTEHKLVRNVAKTFIYAFLYGAGVGKIGSIVGKGPKAGAQLRKKFLEGLPALARLIEAMSRAAERGHLIGLDGRRLIVRSEHAALNTLLQGAGAIIMKQAMKNWHELMAAQGFHHGNDYRQVLWIHDEFQAECRTAEIAAVCGSTMVDAIRKVTSDFNLRCPLDGEHKLGANWAETH